MFTRVRHFALMLLTTLLIACSSAGITTLHSGELNLGRQTDNSSVPFQLMLLNSSNAPITIDSVTTSVSHLVSASSFSEPIQPGDTLHLPMLLLTHTFEGEFIALVRIHHSASSTPLEQQVRGVIERTPVDITQLCTVPFGPLLIQRNLLNMGEIRLDARRSDSLLVYNPTDQSVSVTLPRTLGPVGVTMSSPHVNPGKAAYIVVTANYQVGEDKIGERIFHSLRFSFDRDLRSDANLYVQGELAENFDLLTPEQRNSAPRAEIDPRTYDFGTIEEGAEVTHPFQLTNSGKSVLKIRNYSSSCDCTILKLQQDSLKPGETMPINLFFNSKGKYGPQQRQIKLKTNDPENAVIELWLTGEVK